MPKPNITQPPEQPQNQPAKQPQNQYSNWGGGWNGQPNINPMPISGGEERRQVIEYSKQHNYQLPSGHTKNLDKQKSVRPKKYYLLEA